MKWDYLVLKVKPGMLESDEPLSSGPRFSSVGSDNLQSALNELGAQGWEGFGTVADSKGFLLQVLLKKQK